MDAKLQRYIAYAENLCNEKIDKILNATDRFRKYMRYFYWAMLIIPFFLGDFNFNGDSNTLDWMITIIAAIMVFFIFLYAMVKLGALIGKKVESEYNRITIFIADYFDVENNENMKADDDAFQMFVLFALNLLLIIFTFSPSNVIYLVCYIFGAIDAFILGMMPLIHARYAIYQKVSCILNASITR